MKLLTIPLGYIMYICYQLTNNYALSIVLFTLATKIILLPVSLWVHKNGTKMVKLMPDLNRIKLRYFGDNDKIADETQALYKQVHYNPLAPILTRTSKKARRFLFYYYLEEDHMYEYLQKGKADNLDTLVPTGNEYIR